MTNSLRATYWLLSIVEVVTNFVLVNSAIPTQYYQGLATRIEPWKSIWLDSESVEYGLLLGTCKHGPGVSLRHSVVPAPAGQGRDVAPAGFVKWLVSTHALKLRSARDAHEEAPDRPNPGPVTPIQFRHTRV
jgi:hypothetical protein